MFQKGKVVHEPSSPSSRKFSETGSVANAVRRASTSSTGSNSGDKSTNTGGSFPTSGRRVCRHDVEDLEAKSLTIRLPQSSAASGGGLFSNLNNVKRGSEDYGEKRASHHEMTGSGGGMIGGWFNQTFKGGQKPAGPQKDDKRGVME